MSGWKKRWKKELDAAIPALDERVFGEPIRVADKTPETSRVTLLQRLRACREWLRRRNGLAVWAVGLACVVTIIAVLPRFSDSPVATADVKISEAIAVYCGAETAFTVDKDGFVADVISKNGESDVIFSSLGRAEKLRGLPVETASGVFTDYAAKLGFLDISEQTAVLVTSTKTDGKLQSVDAALEEYFCERGIYAAVVTECVSVAAFADEMGVSDVTEEETLWKRLRNMPLLRSERRVLTESEDLQTAYRESVPTSTLKDFAEYVLRSRLTDIEENLRVLERVKALAKTIKTHKDNPYRYFADYWSLLALDRQYSPELQAELNEMQAELAAYEERFGQTIDSLSTFVTTLYAVSRDNAYGELVDVLSEFTVELFEERFTEWTQMLKNVGVNVLPLEYWYEVPNDETEYREKTLRFENVRFYTLLAKNSKTYEAERSPLTSAEYTAFLKNICKTYGSLSAYWKFLQKN